ncbi:HAD family hydrolase [Corynebacterium lowii]|uniref:Phosphorylated carbohydrates phosphatase n=1 Tax=Corynebacterium lowii TaxID=1544413 RepID=A0A0Q0YGM6_9CORY|nr:HAD family phosphatase [Corynebacterium lowii]KQB85758.1 Phosphorylated carbohydrates phosphatase [Corynebacterium lowii]MDP9851060.1 HAD superfamily hydrolase (TIGR01509 family) [Corynebacterium lowii]
MTSPSWSNGPRAIFWDMDGTLVDSEPLWGIATYELSEHLGRRLTPELRAATVGGSFHHTLQVCADHAGVEVSPEQAKELHDAMFARVGRLFEQSLAPRPGVRPLLEGLRALGVPMMVTTNTERALADPSIKAVGEQFFCDSVAGDEAGRFKPAPDMYVEAARRLGVAPQECLVFEDSQAGMTAAVAAGCQVIGLPEDESDLVEGVLLMQSLHGGSRSFEGVRAADVERWFTLSTQA